MSKKLNFTPPIAS